MKYVLFLQGEEVKEFEKNIRFFCGKPIIQWSIEAALESKCFDKVIVSTDSEEISKVSKRIGAKFLL